jgi:hypothetical protein
MAESKGFEPLEACTSTVFETAAQPSCTPKTPRNRGAMVAPRTFIASLRVPIMAKFMAKRTTAIRQQHLDLADTRGTSCSTTPVQIDLVGLSGLGSRGVVHPDAGSARKRGVIVDSDWVL